MSKGKRAANMTAEELEEVNKAIRAATEKYLEDTTDAEREAMAAERKRQADKAMRLWQLFFDDVKQSARIMRILAPYIQVEMDAHPEIYGDDADPTAAEGIPLEVLIVAAAKRARDDGVEVPHLMAEGPPDQKEGEPVPDKIAVLVPTAVFTPGDKALSFSGKGVSIWALTRTRGRLNTFGDALVFDDVFMSLNGAKRLGVGEAKLLRYGVCAFTKANTHNSRNIKLRVEADTKEFARACNVAIDQRPMDTPEEQQKEATRASKALDNFVTKLQKNARNLLDVSSTWTETAQKGKSKSYNGVSLLGGYKVRNDTIMLEFTQSAAEYLISRPYIEVPTAYYAIDDRKPNAFAIADALILHYSMHNNVIRNTESVLRVSTLLRCTSFPAIDEVEKKRNSWTKLIKEPFEAAMDELYQKGLIAQEVTDPETGAYVSGGWRYSLAGKQPLTEAEAAAIIDRGFSNFVSLYVVYELAGFEPHDVRKAAIAAAKAEAIEKSKRSRTRGKRKPAKTATSANEGN